MVIETFVQGPGPVYARFRDRGRLLPTGLHYIDSWLTRDGHTCFQLMETDDPTRFDAWTARWADLVQFDIRELGEKPTESLA